MKKVFLFFGILLCLFSNKEAKATHYAGGELIYEWISDSTFKFTAILYRNCAYPNASGGNNQSATFGPTVDMCWLNTTTGAYGNLTLDSVGGFSNLPVSTGCPGAVTQCTDLASAIPGYQEWHYSNNLTLTGPSNLYRFWLSNLCCRNGGITNLLNPGGASFFIEATLNWNAVSASLNKNSSPVFTNKPTPYICVNQPYSYNNQGVDINGDSLVYTSIDPQTNTGVSCATPGNSNVGYVAATPPYNATNNPFFCNSTFAVNATTGIMQVTPAAIGQVVVSVRCSEYRNGVLIGSMMRDIQISIVNCLIATPTAALQLNTINNLTYNGVTGNFDGCPGDTITFCSLITGAIDTSAIQVSTDAGVGTVLPGAVATITGYGTDSALVCISWVPGINDTSLNVVTINYHDTSCAYNITSAIISYSLPIYIHPVTEAYGDTAVCAQTPVPLLAVGGSVFNWQALPGGSGNGSLSCLTCNNPIATPNVTTTYVVTSNSNSICADNLDTVVVTVLPIPNIIPVSDDTICSNGVYPMNAVVTTPGNFAYSWSPAAHLDNSTIPNPVIINPLNGTASNFYNLQYILTVNPIGFNLCSAKDTVNFLVIQGMNIVNPDTTVCDGDPVNVSTTGGNLYTYTWSPTTGVVSPGMQNTTITALSNTTYTLTATFPGCPDTVDDITINVEPIPDANAGIDRLICSGDTVRLGGIVTPTNANPNFYTYTWNPAFDLSSASILEPYFDGLTTTTFTLSAVTSKGCKDTDVVIVTVVPDDFLTLSTNKTICPNDSATLIAGGALYYNWSPGSWVTDSLGNPVKAFPISTQTYTVIGTDINGCRDTANVEVFVAPGGILNAGPDVTIYPGETAYLNAIGNCSYFNWTPSFGLNNSIIQDPIATPSTSTQYVVVGSTEYGCTAVDTINVTRLNESNINIPNAFTPGNGNQGNDLFRADKNGIAKLNYFRVFNRWGEMLYETTNIEAGWDGSYKGKPQPMGTYMYMIDAETNTGKRFTKTGNVTLLR